MKGKFIVVEGIDGSGKTTLVNSVYQKLIKANFPIAKFSEPTDFPTGFLIRKFLRNEIALSKDKQLEAFLEDRSISLQNNVYPSLNSGKHVLLDRYFYSTCAYQSDNKYSPSFILNLNLEKGFPLPDLVIYLDISPQAALDRINKRKETKERFESLDFLTKVHEAYNQVLEPDTFRVDAGMDATELSAVVEKKILSITVQTYL
ncbi:MAG: dTMP kinase [Leptospiraceae bacterium]|nr:dTMP kinase [Leptospiraceae bacterium]MCP5497290.1 dTMP kinase [Leptospiraceae bacterium]